MITLSKIKEKSVIIGIVGLGYVGLPTAVTFAKKGFKVIGLDNDRSKIELIEKGISPINDEFLIKEIPFLVKNNYLQVTNDYKFTVENSDVILIIVPTPVNDSKEPDLSFVINAASSIYPFLKKDQIIVLESTVYPGVTEEVVLPILEKSGLKTPADFGLAFCPERFNPGDPTHNIENVVRVVGANSKRWTNIISAFYSQIQETFQSTDIKTAEAAKVIENTQRDLNIALMNELALICERINIDVKNVLEAAATKWNFINFSPGPGVGGHCLPHDPYYLVKKAKEHGYHPQVILAGRKVNDEMPYHMLELLIKALNHSEKSIKNSNIAIFGATYKKNIDDLRTSPTEVLVKALLDYEPNIFIFEPNVNQNKIFGQITIKELNKKSLEKMDALIFMVDHDEFQVFTPDFLSKIYINEKKIVIIDGTRFLDGQQLKELRFIYYGIGAGTLNKSYESGDKK